ncbi:CLIP domain-containing serine protease B4 isoform X2 [Anabrus simplex]|uniref:CLIP domain-containing serine protease B4 isoform X2 n=1 Tax=Anabrus simplex TaxID=316456 RepID=UPI0035A33F9B
MRATAAIYFALWITALCVLHSGQASPLVDDNATISRERRAARASCRFRCLSGECLDEDKYECDGIKDCADGSDETVKVCQTMHCQDNLIRCDYGACVDGDARCNGIMNCADSSDEKDCGEKKNTNLCKCQPYGFRCDYGGCIDKNGLCNGVAQCADGSDEKPTECGHPNASPPTPEVITSSLPNIIPNTSNAVDITNRPRVCDPEENLPTPQHSDCGISHRPAGISFIRNGITAKREDFPWNAAVYRVENGGYTVICSGSLVSPRLVISAAHCFWDGNSRRLYPEGNFKIAFGKIHAKWNEEDEHKKILDVARIVINCLYRDEEKFYDDDIAAVYLKGEVTFSKTIYPVCIDWDQKHRHSVKSGEVPGFGLTEEDIFSDVLLKVRLPLVSVDKCEGTLPSRFATYLSLRKFCAGFQNGTGVCNGDSGGGLVFQSEEDDLWYLRGIVSSGVRRKRSEICSKEHYSLFTDVYQFIPWLKKVYS